METYGVADIQGLAKVFTGFSWGGPDTSAARFVDRVVGISDRYYLPMQGYPQFHEPPEFDRFQPNSPDSGPIYPCRSMS
jgi:uncharacterized protein (DUF1800 family)